MSNAGASGNPTAAAVGDLNGDGLPDLAVTLPDPVNPATAPGSVVIFYNLGNDGAGNWIGFSGPSQIFAGVGVNPSGIAIGKLNPATPASRNDIVVTNRGTPGSGQSGTATVLLNGPAGPFAAAQTVVQAVGGEPLGVCVGDFDGDGRRDIALANSRPGNSAGYTGSGSVTILFNQGSAAGIWNLPVPIIIPVPSQDVPTSIQPGDIDASGRVSLAVGNRGSDRVTVLGNLGNARTPSNFSQTFVGVGAGPSELVLANFTNNPSGRLSIATVNTAGNSVSIVLNTGTAAGQFSFNPSVDLPIDAVSAGGSAPSSMTSGDFNGDGKIDLAIVTGASSPSTTLPRVVRVLRNDLLNGQLAFTALGDQAPPATPLLVRSGNLRAPNLTDLVTVNQTASVTGRGDGTRAGEKGLSTLLSNPVAGCPGDVDRNGSVGANDLTLLLGAFGRCPGQAGYNPNASFDSQPCVGANDLTILLGSYGVVCP
ncbi:MAG: VCBS repeat-containing protein [Phycisphaerales bacterium]|nr:VCBS repeat-containing protein [Phycisphaerales bacterium]